MFNKKLATVLVFSFSLVLPFVGCNKIEKTEISTTIATEEKGSDKESTEIVDKTEESTEKEGKDGVDMIVAPTGPKDAVGVKCPKCNEEPCEYFSRDGVSGYRCSHCFLKFGFFEASTVEMIKDNNGFYLIKNNGIYNMMLTTHYIKGNDIITAGIRNLEMDKEEYPNVVAFNGNGNWVAAYINKDEEGNISYIGEMQVDKVHFDLGDITYTEVSSEPLEDGYNILGKEGVTHFYKETKIDEEIMTMEGESVKIDLSSFTINSSLSTLYIQNPVVITDYLDDEIAHVDNSPMIIIAGRDGDIYVNVAITTIQTIHYEEGDRTLVNVNIYTENRIDGSRYSLEGHTFVQK